MTCVQMKPIVMQEPRRRAIAVKQNELRRVQGRYACIRNYTIDTVVLVRRNLLVFLRCAVFPTRLPASLYLVFDVMCIQEWRVATSRRAEIDLQDPCRYDRLDEPCDKGDITISNHQHLKRLEQSWLSSITAIKERGCIDACSASDH